MSGAVSSAGLSCRYASATFSKPATWYQQTKLYQLFDYDGMTDITFPGYIMILVVCAVTLFLIIPKGDTVRTPVMETTVTETVEMSGSWMTTKEEDVAVISPGTSLKIYAVSGISL